WSADITYVRLPGGFVYLVAIIDWYSRYVLSWEVRGDVGERVLCERVKSIAASGEAGDLQHGSGFAVRQLRVHRDSQRARDRHQYGWARPGEAFTAYASFSSSSITPNAPDSPKTNGTHMC